LYEGTGGSGVI